MSAIAVSEGSIVRACPACGQKNRLPAGRLSDQGRCGSCQQDLPPLAEPIEADPQVFDEITQTSKVPVLVDFWAAWCGPCRMVAPEVAKAAENYAGRALVLKVDTDRYPALAERFGVSGIPNFVVFKEGKVVFQQPGYVPHTLIEGWLAKAGA
jgi:thioredoxin 2